MFVLSRYYRHIFWLPFNGENPYKQTRLAKIAKCLNGLSWRRNTFYTGLQAKGPSNDVKKQLLICLFIFSIGVWFLFQTALEDQHSFFVPRNLEFRTGEYLISGAGCHIPALDQYDPSIIDALEEYEAPPNCDSNSSGVLVKSNITHLYIDPLVQSRLNLTSELACCVRPFWRPVYNDKFEFRYFNKCIPFKKEILVSGVEFVRVECSADGHLINKDFYSFIPNYYRSKAGRFSPMKNISVLVLGIDALSRLNFRRQMIHTHNFLITRIKAIEFFGYHKVGDNTFPNLVPVLSGKTEQELIKSCWPSKMQTFDNCSFIWDEFKKAGFITGFGEDASWMGIFEYCKRGFRKKPTDIYLRPFNYVYESELGHDKRMNANICVGPKMNIEVLLDSIMKFAARLHGKLSFGFFWENSLSHDFLNLPQYGDEIHVNLLGEFLEKGIFEQSVIMIMSDHGIRWGKIRTTYQGYVEERLPLLLFSCPDWFKKRFPLAWANLKKNSLRLTTPFDLHETLKDLTNLTLIADQSIIKRSKSLKTNETDKYPRGISLFLPIPGQRTCEDADIIDHWCTCHTDQSIPINTTIVSNMSHFVIGQINSLLKGYPQCSELNVESVINARMKVLQLDTAAVGIMNFGNSTKEYTIMMKAKPGGGMFEATVQHRPHTGEFRLMGSVSRSNTYGNSSYCVSHYKLKLYCYCIT